MRCGSPCFDVNDGLGEHPWLLVCESVGTFPRFSGRNVALSGL